MTTHVTSVTLTTEVDDHQRPVWRITWTTERNGRQTRGGSMPHYSEQAARRHATGLCARRLPGTTVADIFTDQRQVSGECPDT